MSLHKEIGVLAHSEAERLIREPVKESAVTYDEEVVRRMLKLPGGPPYLIQQLCYKCIEKLNEIGRGYEVTEKHLQAAIETALQPSNSTLFSDMWQDIGRSGREVLKILANALSGESSWMPVSKLRDGLRSREVRGEDVNATLDRLTTNRLLVSKRCEHQDELHYGFGMDLLRRYALGQPD